MSVLDDFLPNVKSLAEIKPIAGIRPSMELIKSASHRMGSIGFKALAIFLLTLTVVLQFKK